MVNDEYNVAWSEANCKNHKDKDNRLDIPQPSLIVCIKSADDGCVAIDTNHKWN
jgi:hypothetical protein